MMMANEAIWGKILIPTFTPRKGQNRLNDLKYNPTKRARGGMENHPRQKRKGAQGGKLMHMLQHPQELLPVAPKSGKKKVH